MGADKFEMFRTPSDVRALRDERDKLEAEANRLAIELDLARKDWRTAKAEVEEMLRDIARLRAALRLFDPAVKEAVAVLNKQGVACPAGIALAAEKARAALKGEGK